VAKSYNASLLSSLAISIVAVRVPVAVGSKVTMKVVVPPELTGVVGICVTVKSAACVPVTSTSGVPARFRSASPVFWIVNVRMTDPVSTSASPKSVWSVAAGVVSPSAIDWPLPCRSISGAGAVPLP